MNKAIALFFAVFFCIAHIASANDGKIVGGTLAADGAFPFMIQLYLKNQDFFFCGGSVIGPYHILTAAHCTDGQTASELQIWAGSNDRTDSAGVYIDVAAIYQNANYDSYSITNDISIIKLKTPFPKSSKIRAISLATSAQDPSGGTQVKVAGWGVESYGSYSTPDNLLYVVIPVLTTAQCRGYSGYEDVIGAQQICCYEDGQDSCQGDSGGPLFSGSKDKATQYGVVSWGYGCATNPGVYTRVSYYRSWIKTQTTHTVSTACASCTTDASWKGLCESVGGTYRKTTSQYRCEDIDVFTIRSVSYSWTGCTNTLVKDLCSKVGRYTCSNGVGKCTAF